MFPLGCVHKNLCCVLTFVAYSEADVGVALVGREEQIEEVGGADEKLRNLGALVAANQRRGGEASVADLQHVVVDLGAKPTSRRTFSIDGFASREKLSKEKLNGQKMKISHTVFLFLQRRIFYFKL